MTKKYRKQCTWHAEQADWYFVLIKSHHLIVISSTGDRTSDNTMQSQNSTAELSRTSNESYAKLTSYSKCAAN